MNHLSVRYIQLETLALVREAYQLSCITGVEAGVKTFPITTFYGKFAELVYISDTTLDFYLGSTDTSGNTLAAPLFRQVRCFRNDVHQGRVRLNHNARLELKRITAAPPLMPFRHNAVLGRLLLFLGLPIQLGEPL